MEDPDEEGSEEARPAKLTRGAKAPAKANYDMHMLTHMRYRAWCPWCVTGWGRSAQHSTDIPRRARIEESPLLRWASASSQSAVHQYCAACIKCSHTGVIAAHAMMSKAVTSEIERMAARDIDNLGHTRLVLKIDNELK